MLGYKRLQINIKFIGCFSLLNITFVRLQGKSSFKYDDFSSLNIILKVLFKEDNFISA